MHHAPLHAKSPPQNKKKNGGFGAACEEFGTVTRGSSPISLIFTSVTKHGNWWSSNQFRAKHHRVASHQSTPLNHQSSGETRDKQHIRLLLSTFSGPGAGTPVVFRKMSDHLLLPKMMETLVFCSMEKSKALGIHPTATNLFALIFQNSLLGKSCLNLPFQPFMLGWILIEQIRIQRQIKRSWSRYDPTLWYGQKFPIFM